MNDLNNKQNEEQINLQKKDFMNFLNEISDSDPELLKRAGLLLKLYEMGMIDQEEMYRFADLLDPGNEDNR